MVRIYENDGIKVIWDKDKCVHAGNCVGGNHEVFNLEKRPWIDVNAASVEEIKRVINTCPSGALRYEIPGNEQETVDNKLTIKVTRNGPYQVRGNCELLDANGKDIDKSEVFILCRCGSSKKMPFCDGTHVKIGFKDT